MSTALKSVRKRLGSLRASEISQDVIDDYAAWRLAQKPTGRKVDAYSPSTVSKELRILRACLNDSEARHYITKAQPFRIEFSEGSPRDEYLTQTEVSRMLEYCYRRPWDTEETENRPVYRRHLEGFILIAVTTAARKEAILDLRWSQVHLDTDGPSAGLIDWGEGTFSGRHYIDFGRGAGNKRRPKIPIDHNPRLVNWLLASRGAKAIPDNAHASGMNIQMLPYDPDSHVITYQGERVKDLKKGLKALAVDAEITKKIAPAHTLKHTAITWMVQGRVPLSTISDLTGTSERMIRKVYGHHIPDYREELPGVTRVV